MNLNSDETKNLDDVKINESESQLSTKLLKVSNDDDDDRLTTISQDTTKTNLTCFTNCTNSTFDSVHREWKFVF